MKVREGKIVITDNFMETSLKNLKNNPKVCLCVWSSDGEIGYRIKGNVTYHQNDKWHEFVKNLSENKGFPCKGAVVVSPIEIVKLA